MAESFRALSPEMQSILATTAALAAGLLGLLASINAISLLFGGVAIKSVGKFGAALFGAEKIIDNTTRKAGVLRVGIGKLGSAFALLPAIFARMSGPLLKFIGVATALTPQGAIIRGIVTASTLLAAGAINWFDWGNEAEAAINKAKQIQFVAANNEAIIRADSIIPQTELDDIVDRFEFLQRKIDATAALTSGLDTVNSFQSTGAQASSDVTGLRAQLDAMRSEFDELDDVIKERDAILARLSNYGEGKLPYGNARTQRGILRDQVDELYAGLDAETAGALAAFEAGEDQLRDTIKDGADIALRSQEGRKEALREFLNEILVGTTSLSGELEGFTPALQAALQDASVFRFAAELLLSQDGDISERDVLIQALSATGDQAAFDIIASLYTQKKKNDISALSAALAAGNAEIAAEIEALRIQNLEAFAAQSTNLKDALAATQEAGLAQLEVDLADLVTDSSALYEDIFAQFGFDQRDGFSEALNSALANSGYSFEGTPGLAELFGGGAVVDAINAQIDADTSVEEANAIAEAEFQKYAAIMDNIIDSIAEAVNIPDSVVAGLKDLASNALARIQSAVINGLNGVDGAIKATGSRVARANKRSSGGSKRKKSGGGGKKGKSAEDLAKEAVRDARKIEDAFKRAETQALSARAAYLDNVRGLDVNTRINLTAEVDIAKITADADKQIQSLKRQLEDLKLDGKANSALESQINETIRLVELEKQAQIDSATSFDAQMDRRSKAIDLFIRDLKTLASESTSTFDKVAAGIGVAFAEYNKDLVTLVDITSEAVGSFLDAVTTGIADFIFDNENAWENFKKTMLNISRQVFEGFTKALLQQTISSVTGGGGSLFGNSTQPSAAGGANNSQTPSVGTGGILGGLFGGGQQGGAGATGGEAQIQQGTQAVAQALTQGATQIQQAFASMQPQIRSGGTQTASSLQQTSQQVRSSGQQAAQGVDQAGGSLATSINGAARKVQSAGSGLGGIGGGGGGLGEGLAIQGLGFLTSLFGFAEGGLVQTTRRMTMQTNNAIKHYASGGSVVGAGTGTSDDILARLSNGEFVINAKATSEFRPLLEAINSGNIKDSKTTDAILSAFGNKRTSKATPAFAEGGLVGDKEFGVPAVNLTAPRTVMVTGQSRNGSTTNNNVNNSRGGDTIINLRVVQNLSGSTTAAQSKRSADQIAQQVGRAVERSKKNT